MTRSNKVAILNAIASGKANIYDLIVSDGFFIRMGGFYVKDGIRYNEQQFGRIKEALYMNGKKLNCLDTGNSTYSQFLIKYTKPFSNETQGEN
jgi:hypothetical protein